MDCLALVQVLLLVVNVQVLLSIATAFIAPTFLDKTSFGKMYATLIVLCVECPCISMDCLALLQVLLLVVNVQVLLSISTASVFICCM